MSAPITSDLTDIHRGDWVDQRLPAGLRPYARLARLDRPVGIWLTLFPCWAALIQASSGFPPLRELVVFTLGALLMRSAGSTINDIADRNFDAHVERTRFRPLASGQINVFRACLFLGLQIFAASCLLWVLNPLTQILAACVLPLVFLYPFCKRFTHWPQAVLGAAFNWGMLMAWTELRGELPVGAVMMWLGALVWQIGYDTVYAYVDLKDDSRLGLKSTAVLFGRHGKSIIACFYIATVGLWSVGGYLLEMSVVYVVGMGVIAFHLGWQIVRLDFDRPDLNFRLFLANIMTSLLLAVSALGGTWQVV